MTELLFLAHRIPYPPDKGDKIRSWHMLKHLAARTTVHLGAFVDDPDDMRHADMLRDLCGEVLLQPLDPAHRWRRVVRGLVRGDALSIALFDDPAMREWTDALMRRRKIDRLVVFSSQMAPYALPHIDGRRSVMDFVDIDSEKWRQYGAESWGPRRWVYQREARLLRAFEKHVSRRVEASLFVSEAEASLFRKLGGSYAHHVNALSNGVDFNYFDPMASFERVSLPGQPALLFTGAMDYRPNIDAVVWFADAVWPRVRAARPEASFTIVGSKPAPDVLALARRDGIAVTGRVEDVRPYIAAADVVVAPLRIARGIQNKVLEAMAMAKPIVATTPAFEGIDATPGTHLLVEDDPQRMADAIVALASNGERRTALGAAARRQVAARYDWATNLSLLDRLLHLDAPTKPQVAVGDAWI